jgi:hypothetical protein
MSKLDNCHNWGLWVSEKQILFYHLTLHYLTFTFSTYTFKLNCYYLRQNLSPCRELPINSISLPSIRRLANQTQRESSLLCYVTHSCSAAHGAVEKIHPATLRPLTMSWRAAEAYSPHFVARVSRRERAEGRNQSAPVGPRANRVARAKFKCFARNLFSQH